MTGQDCRPRPSFVYECYKSGVLLMVMAKFLSTCALHSAYSYHKRMRSIAVPKANASFALSISENPHRSSLIDRFPQTEQVAVLRRVLLDRPVVAIRYGVRKYVLVKGISAA